MARSQNSFNKKLREQKKRKKAEEKFQKKLDKKNQETSGDLGDMIAYVDEDGNISSTPPEEKPTNNKDNTNKSDNEKRNS